MHSFVTICYILALLGLVIVLWRAQANGALGTFLMPVIAGQQVLMLAMSLYNDHPVAPAAWGQVAIAFITGLVVAAALANWFRPWGTPT